MSEPPFFDRILHWRELAARFVAVLKAVLANRSTPDDPGVLFGQVVEAIAVANSRALDILLDLWQTTPLPEDKLRWMYPDIWQEPGFPPIQFRALVSTASEPEEISLHDWIPSDAASHATLEAVIRSRRM